MFILEPKGFASQETKLWAQNRTAWTASLKAFVCKRAEREVCLGRDRRLEMGQASAVTTAKGWESVAF